MNFGNNFKITSILIIIIVIILTFIFNFPKKVNPKYNLKLIELLKNKEFKFIAHAAGGIDDRTYTNSLEAINNSIKNGFKLIEIDLYETKDKIFVGVHDWKGFKKKANLEIINKDELDYSEFKNIKLYKKYTPLDIEKINTIFQKNKDLFLVTDKTQNFEKIINDFKFDKKRILVEIFGKKNFYKSVKKGILNPIYSFNHKDYDFVISNNIKIVAAHTEDIIKNPKIYKTLIKNDIFVFAYTSNNENFIKQNLDINFTNIYTDFWNISKMKCTSSKNCATY